MSDIDDDDDSDAAEPIHRPPVDYAVLVREILAEELKLDRLTRVADEAARVANEALTAKKSPGLFSTIKSSLGLALAFAGAIGAGSVGLIKLGGDISIVSDRAERAEKSGAHLAGRLDVIEPRVSAIEWQTAAANKERGALTAQIAENATTIARQIEDLRKTREDTSVRLGRIEQRLDDVKAAIERMETRGKWGGLSGQ